MGLKVIFSDIYININSDIYIVLVQILACSNVCRGSKLKVQQSSFRSSTKKLSEKSPKELLIRLMIKAFIISP